MKLSPSLLAGDMASLPAQLAEMEAIGVDMAHFDVMDGHFVPNLTFGPPYIKCARRHSKLPFDVHLMCEEPGRWVEALVGTDIHQLSFHLEPERYGPRLVGRIRELGMKPSIAVNPQTSLAFIEEALPLVDNVMLMSVDPGFAGQPFLARTFTKIEQLVAYREENELVFTVQLDGGVNEGNLTELAELGVDIVVAGKAYYTAADRAAFTKKVHDTRP